MQPVREYGGEKYLRSKRYYPYVGMGFVQLTWKANYEKASRRLGVDFVSDPKLLLKPEYSAKILVIGSKEGWFTGKKLSDYITLNKSDFINARRIINGTDKASLIAGYASEYDRLLKAEKYGDVTFYKDIASVDAHMPKPPELPKPAPQPVADGFMAWLRRFLAA
jgi:hypothetical protein